MKFSHQRTLSCLIGDLLTDGIARLIFDSNNRGRPLGVESAHASSCYLVSLAVGHKYSRL
jgi:hypothetical protein